MWNTRRKRPDLLDEVAARVGRSRASYPDETHHERTDSKTTTGCTHGSRCARVVQWGRESGELQRSVRSVRWIKGFSLLLIVRHLGTLSLSRLTSPSFQGGVRISHHGPGHQFAGEGRAGRGASLSVRCGVGGEVPCIWFPSKRVHLAPKGGVAS